MGRSRPPTCRRSSTRFDGKRARRTSCPRGIARGRLWEDSLFCPHGRAQATHWLASGQKKAVPLTSHRKGNSLRVQQHTNTTHRYGRTFPGKRQLFPAFFIARLVQDSRLRPRQAHPHAAIGGKTRQRRLWAHWPGSAPYASGVSASPWSMPHSVTHWRSRSELICRTAAISSRYCVRSALS